MKPVENSSRHPGPALREDLRGELRATGFDRVGFASAAAPPGTERFLEWIGRGYHGGMDYLARNLERRSRPERVVPGVRTVIVVAVDYRSPSGYGIANPRTDVGEISSYARGTDYHRVLEPRLKRSVAALGKRFPDHRFRYYVDTGPVLEKAWAERAGVGWIGKNTCSIHRERGSFFFLGAILTTLAVPPDEPATDHCGACSLCIEACPTGAIVEPYVLDARLCISYLTIEHRGSVGPDLEDRMENLIFGCDVCQEVCPWNSPERGGGDPELAPRDENVFPSLRALAGLSPETFRDRFRASAVKRTKYRGFLRNVLIALGNSGRPEFLELLARIADQPGIRRDPVLRAALERARTKIEHASDTTP